LSLPSTRDLSLPQTFKAAASAVGGIAGFEGGARLLLPDRGWSVILVPLLSASALLALCAYVVFARVERPLTLTVADSSIQMISEPLYGPQLRLLSTIGLAAFSLILSIRVFQIAPNAILRRTHVTGVVCASTSATPLTSGTVGVLSKAATVVSVRPQPLDDRGV